VEPHLLHDLLRLHHDRDDHYCGFHPRSFPLQVPTISNLFLPAELSLWRDKLERLTWEVFSQASLKFSSKV